MKTALILAILANLIILKIYEDVKKYNKKINRLRESGVKNDG